MKLVNHKKVIIIGATAVAITAGLILTPLIYGRSKQPDYQTIAPYGKAVNDLGGWKRVSPPSQDPVFAYTDTIDGTPISVSQQPLPKSFLNDTQKQVSELATKFNATNKIDAFGTIVHVGTSAKGPQSVIFTKNDLLIMIKSQKKVSDQSWAEYVQSLVVSTAS